MSRRSEWFNFSRWRAWFRRRANLGRRLGIEPALRSELFSADQMERHGRALASAHRVTTARSRDLLLARLDDNEAVLIDACELLTTATRDDRRISPAAEWLLDNFYLVEEQIRTAHRHLPKGYSRELPRLAKGPSAGTPRVYDIALEAISHGDGRIDAETLRRFVASYQSVTPLQVGRTLGNPDHAAAGVDREPAPGRRSRDRREDRSPPGRTLGRPVDGCGRTRSQERGAGGRRHGAFRPADEQLLRGRIHPPPARPEFGAGLAADLGGALAVRRRLHHRAPGADGSAATGRRPGFHRQQHRQPARPVVHRLAGIRRIDEPGRDDLARGSGRRLCRDGLRHPRSLSARGGKSLPGAAMPPSRRWRAPPSAWPTRRSRRATARAPCMSGSISSAMACDNSSGPSMRASASPNGCGGSGRSGRCLSTWAASPG